MTIAADHWTRRTSRWPGVVLFLGLGGVGPILLGWLMSRGAGRPARAAMR